jgi:hypothetical protein
MTCPDKSDDLANGCHCVLSRNTCLAGQGDNSGVEMHYAQVGWACEVPQSGGAVGPPANREQGSVKQRQNLGGSSFCSSRMPSGTLEH